MAKKNKKKKNSKLRDAIIQYALELSIALIASLFTFYLTKTFGFPLD